MTQLTLEEAEAVLKVHEAAEMAVDYEGTIATLSDDPHYELPTVGWKLDGAEAVREFYRRTLPYFAARDIYATKRVHALAASGNILCREAHPVVTVNGKTVQCNYSAVVVIDDDGKIVSERLYVDPFFGSLFAEALGDDFAQVPGVTRLPWVEFATSNV